MTVPVETRAARQDESTVAGFLTALVQGHGQRTDGVHCAFAVLGDGGGLPGEHRASSGPGVDGVALAPCGGGWRGRVG